MREGRTVTMGRYSRKQSVCAGKESAEDFGKRREDQREISAHLQLNYADSTCFLTEILSRNYYRSYSHFIYFVKLNKNEHSWPLSRNASLSDDIKKLWGVNVIKPMPLKQNQ